MGRHELHGFLALFPFQKAGGYQLFQNPGTGGRGSQALTLRILRHIIFPGSFHRGKQCILRKMLRRAGFALFQNGIRNRKGLALRQIRQRFVRIVLVRLRGVFQAGTVGSLQHLPAGTLYGFSFGRKLRTGALHNKGSF